MGHILDFDSLISYEKHLTNLGDDTYYDWTFDINATISIWGRCVVKHACEAIVNTVLYTERHKLVETYLPTVEKKEEKQQNIITKTSAPLLSGLNTIKSTIHSDHLSNRNLKSLNMSAPSSPLHKRSIKDLPLRGLRDIGTSAPSSPLYKGLKNPVPFRGLKDLSISAPSSPLHKGSKDLPLRGLKDIGASSSSPLHKSINDSNKSVHLRGLKDLKKLTSSSYITNSDKPVPSLSNINSFKHFSPDS